MPHSVEWEVTVNAPAAFVSAYLKDVRNWPEMQLLAVDMPGNTRQELHWEGPPWSVGSGLVNEMEMEVRAGFVKTRSKSQFRYEIQSPQPGELYRMYGKKMGVKAVITCTVQEVDSEQTTISYRSDIDGWASAAFKLLPAEKMAAQMSEAVSSVIELAWLRSLEEQRAATSIPDAGQS